MRETVGQKVNDYIHMHGEGWGACLDQLIKDQKW
jgi:hypothetical protein